MKNLKILFENMEYFIPFINDDRINYSYKIHRGYRVQHQLMKKSFKLTELLIGNWKDEIDSTDIFIMFDSHYSRDIANYIKYINPSSKIYFYFWNIITDKNKHFFDENVVDQFWTFDSEDAKKYSINYNPQFYTRNITLNQSGVIMDTFFLGREKNRKEITCGINDTLDKLGLNAKVYLIPNGDTLYSYPSYLEKVAQSKSILDIINPNQSGLTLRCMESLFFQKKLITNNLRISEYDFYNPQNIFILGKDNDGKLLEFINSDYIGVDEEVVANYDYSNWVKRFTKN